MTPEDSSTRLEELDAAIQADDADEALRPTPQGYCPKCGYRMDPGVCPECGMEVEPQALLLTSRAERWRRILRRALIIGPFLIVLTGFAYLKYENRWIRLLSNQMLFRLSQSNPVNACGHELFSRHSKGKLSIQESDLLFGRIFKPVLNLADRYPLGYVIKPEVQIKESVSWSDVNVQDCEAVVYIDAKLVEDATRRYVFGSGSQTHGNGRSPVLSMGHHTVRMAGRVRSCAFGAVHTLPFDLSHTVEVIEGDPSNIVTPVWDQKLAEQMRVSISAFVTRDRTGSFSACICFRSLPVSVAWRYSLMFDGVEVLNGELAREAMRGLLANHLSHVRSATGSTIPKIELLLTPSFDAALDARLSSFFAGEMHWKLLQVTEDKISITNHFNDLTAPDRVEEWHSLR